MHTFKRKESSNSQFWCHLCENGMWLGMKVKPASLNVISAHIKDWPICQLLDLCNTFKSIQNYFHPHCWKLKEKYNYWPLLNHIISTIISGHLNENYLVWQLQSHFPGQRLVRDPVSERCSDIGSLSKGSVQIQCQIFQRGEETELGQAYWAMNIFPALLPGKGISVSTLCLIQHKTHMSPYLTAGQIIPEE